MSRVTLQGFRIAFGKPNSGEVVFGVRNTAPSLTFPFSIVHRISPQPAVESRAFVQPQLQSFGSVTRVHEAAAVRDLLKAGGSTGLVGIVGHVILP